MLRIIDKLLVGNGFIFLQDNDPQHPAIKVILSRRNNLGMFKS